MWGGAPPPQRPLSYNIPRRPGADIRNRSLLEGVQPDHVPPGPMCRPCACPGTRPNSRLPPNGQAGRLHSVSPKDGIQRQPPQAPIPRQTVPTLNLECTPYAIRNTFHANGEYARQTHIQSVFLSNLYLPLNRNCDALPRRLYCWSIPPSDSGPPGVARKVK